MNSTRMAFAALGIAGVVGAGALGAQGRDARWDAWIGCWAPVAGQNGAPRELGGTAPTRVCVAPALGTSAVEIVTVVMGKVLDRTRIEADGVPHPVSRDGCSGTEIAHWAMTGTRVYVGTELTCAGGVQRRGKSVMSFTQRYEWLDVRGMTSRDASGVSVARYTATDDTTGIPADVRRAVPARTPASNNAALAASAPLTLGDISEVATTVDSGVATTWLVERTQGVKVSVNGKQLEVLADQGVPSSVIDVVVAMAHPDVFVLNPNSREAEYKTGGQRVSSAYRGAYGSSGWYGSSGLYGSAADMGLFGYGWSPYGMYSPWYGYMSGMWSPYGYRYGYSPGYGGFGYNPYYGYYPGTQPIIVVNRGSDGDNTITTQPHGRVVKGQGYTSPSSSGGGSSSSSGGTGGGASSSAGGASGSAGGTSSSGGGGDARTAVKKPPQ